jgi:hypothetical protein
MLMPGELFLTAGVSLVLLAYKPELPVEISVICYRSCASSPHQQGLLFAARSHFSMYSKIEESKNRRVPFTWPGSRMETDRMSPRPANS